MSTCQIQWILTETDFTCKYQFCRCQSDIERVSAKCFNSTLFHMRYSYRQSSTNDFTSVIGLEWTLHVILGMLAYVLPKCIEKCTPPTPRPLLLSNLSSRVDFLFCWHRQFLLTTLSSSKINFIISLAPGEPQLSKKMPKILRIITQ